MQAVTSELTLNLFVGIQQGLRDYSCIGNDRHEVTVTLPARDYMTVDVVINPGTGNLSDIRPYVKTGGLKCFSQHLDTAADNFNVFVKLLRGQSLQTGHMAIRDYQQVSRVVWIAV